MLTLMDELLPNCDGIANQYTDALFLVEMQERERSIPSMVELATAATR